MTRTCPQCGAALPADTECRDVFDRCLAKEFEDPAFGAVHHLTVPAYLLQHNGYSRSGWLEARRLLDGFVHGGLTPSEARRQARAQAEARQQRARTEARRQHGARAQSGGASEGIISGPRLEGVDCVRWTSNIGDVRLESADVYCEDVRWWAASVLADTEALVARLDAQG